MRFGIMDKPIGAVIKGNFWVDKETGYLTSQNAKFTPELKAKFVELLRDLFPNVYAAAELVGVTYTTVRHHMEIDKKLSQDVIDIKNRSVDAVEGDIFKFSRNPKNFMDRIAVMRAYRGEIYNPKSTIIHQKGMSDGEMAARKTGLAGALDVSVMEASAEILEAEVVTPEEQSTVQGDAGAASSPLVNTAQSVADGADSLDPLSGLDE